MSWRWNKPATGLGFFALAPLVSADTIRLVYDIERGIPVGSHPELVGGCFADALVRAPLPGSSSQLWRRNGETGDLGNLLSRFGA
jgi:hypothetical protein